MRIAVLPRILIALILLGGLLFFGTPQHGLAAFPEARGQQSLYVVGEGQALVPMQAPILHLGLNVQAGDASTAQSEGMRTARRVEQALVQAGVASGDVTVTGLRIAPAAGPATEPHFQFTETLAVRLGREADIGKVLDAATHAGATEVNGVQWGAATTPEAKSQAIKAALTDARRKAVALAQAMGVRLGPPERVALQAEGTGPAPSGSSLLVVRVQVVYLF